MMNIVYFIVFFGGLSALFIYNFFTDIKVINDDYNILHKEKQISNKENAEGFVSSNSTFFMIDYNQKDSAKLQIEIDKYFNYMISIVKKAKSEIIIVDYAKHGKPLEKIDNDKELYVTIAQHYEKYYSEIEKSVKKRGIKYTRIICLPPSKELLDPDDSKVLTKRAISYLFEGMFKHVERLKNNTNFKLYILPNPIRTYSILIADKKTLLFEMDSYDCDLECKPDLLFIHPYVNGGNNIVDDEYNKISERLIGKPTTDISELRELKLESVVEGSLKKHKTVQHKKNA